MPLSGKTVCFRAIVIIVHYIRIILSTNIRTAMLEMKSGSQRSPDIIASPSVILVLLMTD